MLEGERDTVASPLGDVGGEQRLAGRARQLGGVLGDAAAAERERVPRQAGLHLAQDAVGRFGGHCLVPAGHEHEYLGGENALAFGECGDRAVHRSAGSALGDGSHPSAPAVVCGRLRMGAGDDHARAPLEDEREILGPRKQRLAV